jgi:hypothetical protein
MVWQTQNSSTTQHTQHDLFCAADGKVKSADGAGTVPIPSALHAKEYAVALADLRRIVPDTLQLGSALNCLKRLEAVSHRAFGTKSLLSAQVYSKLTDVICRVPMVKDVLQCTPLVPLKGAAGNCQVPRCPEKWQEQCGNPECKRYICGTCSGGIPSGNQRPECAGCYVYNEEDDDDEEVEDEEGDEKEEDPEISAGAGKPAAGGDDAKKVVRK